MEKYYLKVRQQSVLYLFLVLFVFTTIPLLAADLYVSKSGNDGNAGSMGSPKLTIQAAIAAASAGDVINVAAGTYNESLIFDKSLTLQGVSTDKSLQVLDGTGLGTKSGIVLNNGVTNVTIKNFTIQKFVGGSGNSHGGIYGIGGNNNLTVTNVALLDNVNSSGFYANGPITNVSITNSVVNNHGTGARGIVIWNGLKQNITISNNSLTNNNCCGIELQDGTASNVQINGNTIDISGGDNAIGVSGLNTVSGANTINNNTITGGGRYGIEIKNPAGGVTVSGNNVSLTSQNSDLRDRAGIAVFRRGKQASNVDVPNGVTITGNTVTGYQQSSSSEGFGIVIEGTNHSVTGNTLTNNEVGILQQQNTSDYPGDADQSNLVDQYFGRGNSPITCGNTISGNTFSGNTTDTRNVGGIGSGLVTNTSTNEYFCSIQPAINDADTQDGHTITVAAGTYSEQVIVNKSLIVKGVGATKPIINFTGSVTGKPALFDVSKPNVTIENFDMKVDLTKLSSAIIASGTNISGIIVKDNNVLATGSSASASTGTYTDRNAVSVNYGGTNNYRTAAGGVSAISFTGNTVGGETDAFSMTRYFRSGISVDEGGGTFSGNTLQTINHDVLVRFGSNGAITISNNNFNGGGIELADQNAAAGPISVESNLFNATFANTSAPGAAVLRIKNNYNGIVHTVSSNTFTNFNWAASVENMNNITFNGNTFSGLNSNSRSLVFNTKSISGNSNAISQVAVGMIATNNTFEGQGTALSFLNHDSDNDSYGTFTIGTAGNENTFASSLGTFVFLDGQSGSSNGSTFPTYLTTGQWPTTMECWGQNLNIVNNRFDIGSGLQSPLSMNLSQRTTLEGKLDHKPDVSCKGALQFFLPVHNLTQNTYFSTIQAAITAAVSGDVIECSEATYNESLIFDKSLTLQGVSTDKSLQVLDGTGLGTKSGIVLNNGVTNVTIKNFTIQKFVGGSGNSHGGIYGIGGNNNLTVTNVALLDNVNSSGFYANGPITNVSITNSVVNNHGTGARGIVIWNGLKQNITISNNSLTNNNCCGIELQDGTASNVQINGNTIDISGGDNAIGVSGLNTVSGANTINNNTITGGGRYGIEIKNPAGGVTVSGNNVSLTSQNSDLRDRAGIAVFRRGKQASNVDVPNGVTITGNTVTGYQQSSSSEGFGIVIEGTNHSVTGNTLTNNEVGILQQQNTSDYPGDADQSNLVDQYFGRGNSPITCGNTISGNTFSGNTTDTRNVGGIGSGLVTNTSTNEYFCSIQPAINDADTQNGHIITVAAGTYKEDVSVTKQLTINGAGIDASIVEGPIGGGGATFQIAANGVIINGFTITRAGNNTTDWNNVGLNTAGVAVQGQTSKVELKNSKLVGNRNAIDVNNSNGNNIHNNIITNNRTGVIFRNQTDNTLFTENEVTDNWTVGILFLDASGGSNSPVQTAVNSTFSQNKITGNWYGGVVDRQTGGSLPAAGSNLKGFNCNWYGTTSPVISTANSSEPMYADLIPVAFGGTASNPGGAPDIAGIASANIQYAPFLSSGTDSDGGTVGFQPVPGSCVPCVGVATIGTATTICEGGNATITVTGTPNTSVTYNINGSGSYTLALNGAGTGTFNTGALSSTTTYNLVSGINGSCTSTLTGSVTITVNLNHSIALSSAVGTDAQASCIGTAIVPITYTLGGAASGVSITGLPAGVTYAVNGGVVSISGVPTASGVFSYNIVTTGPCVTTSTTGTITVNIKPQIKIVANGTKFVEGNNTTLCDIDANPSNNTLASTITTNCLSGPVLWRTKIGAAAWSDWTATAPTSQPSDNTEYQYQASCNACPSTITNAISIKINYRASTPQNVSMVADGTTIQAGQSATLCDQDGNALVFNATCGAGEVLLYSVDGGDYSTTIPSQIVDGNFHNYRVRCRKSDGTPSCIETESAVMTLKLTTISITPTVSITPLNSCTASSTFTGSTTCGSFATLWYDATTNQVLPNLPTTPPTTTTSYYARCQNAEGCLSTPSNTVTYTVLPVNVAPIVTASAESVCTGTSVTLTTNCPAGASVLWNTSATDAVLTVAFNNAITQSYSAQCILGSGCQTPFSEPKSILWKSFDITLINIGQSQSAVKASNDKALWSSQFITKDGGPDLDFSNQGNPTIYFTENLNKTAPRYWTIHADACALGTNGSLTFDMRATPETGVVRSFNTHENNAPYFMYANREGWTELYAPNHPAYGFYQVNEAGGNIYDEGLPKGLYKLSVRYWDMKGWGSIYPATRQPQGNVLAYQEFWFRIVSKDGPGQGAARSAVSGQQLTDGDLSSNSTSFAQVMPNPVTKVMRLGIQGAKGQTVKAELVDVAGRSMLERRFVPETQSHQEEFEVEKLVEGIYFLRVTTPDKQATLKVVKF